MGHPIIFYESLSMNDVLWNEWMNERFSNFNFINQMANFIEMDEFGWVND